MIYPHRARAMLPVGRCGRPVLRMLASSELYPAPPQSHTIHFGNGDIWRRPGSSLAKPSSAVKSVATTAEVNVDRGGSFGCGAWGADNAARSTKTTTFAGRSTEIGAGTGDSLSTDAPLSTTRVVGVSEAPVSGGIGGRREGSRSRQYWASDSTVEGFLAESFPTQSIEKKIFRTAEMMLAFVLPSGFPDSVRHPYKAYAGWQFTGMVASAAAGVMSTQALLYAMGLGAGAIPLAATLNWVIKDGLGQLGGVAFSSFVNTRFDANPKLWRMVAAISLDASMVLELLSPFAPAYFLLIASVANIGKNVSFLAASASRAAIHNVLCLKGNLADVTAKSGAQTLIACMVGTGTGVVLSSLLGSNFETIIPACLCLSAVHLMANHMSVHKLGIPTFSLQRLEYVTDAFVLGGGRRRMLTPQDVAVQEQVAMQAVREKLGLDRSPTVAVGSRLEEAVRDWRELEQLSRACRGLPFLLSVRGDLSSGTGDVHILLLEGCEAQGVLAGGYVALLAKRLLVERGLNGPHHARRRSLLPLPRPRSNEPAPTGEIMLDVVEEAIKQGVSLLAPPPPSSSHSAGSEPKLTTVDGDGAGGDKHRASQRGQGTSDGSLGEIGGIIAAEFNARAEQAGWNTSALFLEKQGAVRLRLIHQCE